MTINDNIGRVTIELKDKKDRLAAGQRLSDEVEEAIIEDLSFLQSRGLVVETQVESG